MPAALTLYVDKLFSSPYAMSVYVALVEKGIDFDVETIDLNKGEQHQASFAHLSISGRVPTITRGAFTLSESSAISEYLEDLYPTKRALYPASHESRARARQLQAWIRSDFAMIRRERTTATLFHKFSPEPLSAAAHHAAQRLFAAIDPLIADAQANLFGEWSIADLDLALLLNRMVLSGDDVPAKLAGYATNQWKRPSVQQWLNLPRPIA